MVHMSLSTPSYFPSGFLGEMEKNSRISIQTIVRDRENTNPD